MYAATCGTDPRALGAFCDQPAAVVGGQRRTGRPYEVTVTATDRDGDVLLRHQEPVVLERELPHGDECPACRVGTLQVSFPG